MRTFSALVVAAGLVASLAACSSTPTQQIEACTPGIASGTASDLIVASGEGEPDVTFPTPVIATKSERTFETTGDGAIVNSGDIAQVQLIQLDGASGEAIGSTWSNEVAPLLPISAEGNILSQLIECSTVGSRIVAAVPVSEFTDTVDDESATAIFVLDVIDAYPGKAEGAAQLPVNGLPSIVTSPDGHPGFTFPSSDAPTAGSTTLLQKGAGSVVDDGDNVVLQYSSALWSTQEIALSSWGDTAGVGTPISTTIDGNDAVDENSSVLLPADVKAELVGLTVGSQVMIVVAADGDALVYVIDILAIQQ